MVNKFFDGLSDLWEGRQEIGGAFVDAAKTMSEQTKQEAVQIAEQAKESVRAPLRDVLSSVAGIAKKAIPSALSACASLQYTGGQASFASFLQPIHVRSKYLLIGTNRHNTIGYPLEKYRQLSTLSGFTQCQNVKLELSGNLFQITPTLEEQNLIKDYLEAGFYIE